MGTWGGKRKGAGAPKGNINALKTGEHSEKVVGILNRIADNSFVMLTKKGGLRLVRRKES